MNSSARALIVDASPFIGLAKIGREDLLTLYRCPFLLPETVVQEITAGPVGDPARLALSHPWVEHRPDAAAPPALAAFRLDAGERAVLSLGLTHPGALLVLDDGDGRRAARALSLPFTGTIGIALQARQTGRLPALAPVLRDPQRVGLYLPTDAQIRQLLAPWGGTLALAAPSRPRLPCHPSPPSPAAHRPLPAKEGTP